MLVLVLASEADYRRSHTAHAATGTMAYGIRRHAHAQSGFEQRCIDDTGRALVAGSNR